MIAWLKRVLNRGRTASEPDETEIRARFAEKMRYSREMVSEFLTKHGLSKSEIDARVEALGDCFDLGDDVQRPWVSNKLNELGSTPNEIARTLRQMGIKGTPCRNMLCPIAKYIAPHFLFEAHPSVCADYVWAVNEPMISLPQAVKDFIVAFDNGAYPDLVEGV